MWVLDQDIDADIQRGEGDEHPGCNNQQTSLQQMPPGHLAYCAFQEGVVRLLINKVAMLGTLDNTMFHSTHGSFSMTI